MRGRGRSKKVAPRSYTGQPTEAREALERKWFGRMTHEDDLGPLVTGEQNVNEPFHRWLTLRQAFSPELVRRFLAKAAGLASGTETLPLLDPFAGSGTFTTECARQGVEARGIEALESLAFVARARGCREVPNLPDLAGSEAWEQVAERLDLPIHRAALICAVARRHTSEGKLNRSAPPLSEVLGQVVEMMGEDARSPLPLAPRVERGDARHLEGFADGSVGGILTSPPYLSSHDYTRATRPHETVYHYWHAGRDLAERRRDQVRAHPRAYAHTRARRMPPAVTEACQVLVQGSQRKLAGVVRSYFEDMFAALTEFDRALARGCPCWVVVGGARVKDVYVPADTILADLAEACGMDVVAIRVARRLTPGGRKFGGLTNVAPRESILVLRKRAGGGGDGGPGRRPRPGPGGGESRLG